MTADIFTEYLGLNEYRVSVRLDGRLVETLPATCGTVVRVRNQACAHWAGEADEVTGNAIPDAHDMRNHRFNA